MRSSYEKILTSSGILNIKGIGKIRVKKILKVYPDILKKQISHHRKSAKTAVFR